jgi:uncharacterized membrane protein SpoIIM required for sporulation
VYFAAFLGIFIGLIIIGSIFGTDLVYNYQTKFLDEQHSIGAEAVAKFSGKEYAPTALDVLGLFSHNLEVLLIAFVLSVFYGAGAVFLIVLNASLFSAFMFYLVNAASRTAGTVILVHFVPEIFGFLLAGMAGAILSVALLNEKFGSKYFKNVMKNIVILLVIAIALVFIASVLEIYVSGSVIHSLVSL